ncbi:MAG: hypothetical protein JW729_03450 [Bacteroidales bacterium]|nr:hypothetical protein [Bacteroidales bacterium]
MPKIIIQNQIGRKKMISNSIEQRQNLQKTIIQSFHKELQILDAELQSTLVDDMITAFFNRLKVLKRIQETQKEII